MTLPELIGGLVGAAAAAGVTYRAIASKVETLVGKGAPKDDSLRDVVMRIEGKIDAQHEQTSEQLGALSERVGNLEARVFTPPARRAMRSAPGE